jgi:hypothetical protein
MLGAPKSSTNAKSPRWLISNVMTCSPAEPLERIVAAAHNANLDAWMSDQQLEHSCKTERERPLRHDCATNRVGTILRVSARCHDGHFIKADLELLNGGEVDEMMGGVVATGVESFASLYAGQ